MYVDPVQRAHEQRAQLQMAHPQPHAQQPAQPVQSPLANLDQAIPKILYGNGPQRYRSPVESAVVGGILGGLIGLLISRRRAEKRGDN